VQLVEALRYKSESHRFNSWWCYWTNLPAALWRWGWLSL